MAAPILQIRDAVVGRLAYGKAHGKFGSADFTPRAAMTFDLKQIETRLDVVVVGVGREVDQAARDSDDRDYSIEVGIFKKLNPRTSDEDAATLVELVEQVADYLRSDDGAIDAVPAGGTWSAVDADFVSSSVDPVYDFMNLRKYSRFASSQRIVYRVTADRTEGE